jgi:hypothetical protein
MCSIAKRLLRRAATTTEVISSGTVFADLLAIGVGDLDLSLDFIRSIFETLHDRLFHGILLYSLKERRLHPEPRCDRYVPHRHSRAYSAFPRKKAETYGLRNVLI